MELKPKLTILTGLTFIDITAFSLRVRCKPWGANTPV